MVELSNGCACCSAGDDFFGALSQLVSSSFMRGLAYDHIVFEVRGGARCPQSRRHIATPLRHIAAPLSRRHCST
eukprot:1076220-Prymnesium_polylepis.1